MTKIEIDEHILKDLWKYDQEEKRAIHRAEVAFAKAKEANAKKDGILRYLAGRVNNVQGQDKILNQDKGGEEK